MSVVINSNYAATVAANNLAVSHDMLQKSLNRLSSGSKIVSPSDDAGGLAVSMKLSATAKRQGAVNNNIGNAVSLMQTQDGALKVTGNVLARISELKVLDSDVTKSTSDRANYNTEFTSLRAQLLRLRMRPPRLLYRWLPVILPARPVAWA
jgi:flagellin